MYAVRLIVLHGYPGVGKLTVGRELARLTGFSLFHNHLTVDLVSAIFGFGTRPFVELRESIWLSVIERAAREGVDGLIFTYVHEQTVRPEFIARLTETNTALGGSCQLVELTCEQGGLEKRVEDPSRASFGKLRSYGDLRGLIDRAFITRLLTPRSDLALDTTRIPPEQAAREIVDVLRLEHSS